MRAVERCVRASISVLLLVGVLAAGCERGPAAPSTTVWRGLPAGDVGRLPDGTTVVVDGLIVVEDGQMLFANVTIDVPGGGYESAIDVRGVDGAAIDLFRVPGDDTWWSDWYAVSGTVRDGALHVDALEFARPHKYRGWVTACEAALDGPDDLGTCPEGWYIELYTERFGEPPP